MKRFYFLALITLLATFTCSARESKISSPGTVSFLVSACQEYVELYQKRNEERFGAFLTTSKEESFRAGYCLGAIMHTNFKCRYSSNSRFETAEIIASMSDSYYYSESKLLKHAICR